MSLTGRQFFTLVSWRVRAPISSVQKFKKANKYIKEDTVWSYAIQIAQGLLSLHDKNVLHRDIKPKNVFLTGKAHVRLGDLGCAKLMKGGLARTQIGACPSAVTSVSWLRPPVTASEILPEPWLPVPSSATTPPVNPSFLSPLQARLTTCRPRSGRTTCTMPRATCGRWGASCSSWRSSSECNGVCEFSTSS